MSIARKVYVPRKKRELSIDPRRISGAVKVYPIEMLEELRKNDRITGRRKVQ